MLVNQSFIPGTDKPVLLPLQRFLPPLPVGMSAAVLKEKVPPAGWVLDPLGASPQMALEAARAGYRVLVCANNPVIGFILETLARAHPAETYQAALSDLGLVRRGDSRLDLQLQSYYQTRCPSCAEIIPAQGYVWKKEEAQAHILKTGTALPLTRLIQCPYCQAVEEQAVESFDLEILKLQTSDNLHRARAFERINIGQDSISEGAREVINAYLPRPLNFLFTIINKLEAISASPERMECLQALILSALDEGNALWPWPNARTRPRQFTMPPQFREANLWLTLEQAVQTWSSASPDPVPFVVWPEVPPQSGGICLFRGRVKSLLPLPVGFPLEAIFTVFPRPNQAFWMLSAIWSGWLWGKNAVQPLKSALERQRYDWQWHAQALHSTLKVLSRNIPSSILMYGIVPEISPGFLAAALSAAEAAGFRLQGCALRRETEQFQVTWERNNLLPAQTTPDTPEVVCTRAIKDYLVERAEPAHHMQVYTAALVALADQGRFPVNQVELPADHLTQVQRLLTGVLHQKHIFKRYDLSGQTDETGWWWLVDTPANMNTPLTDRLEEEIIAFLASHPGCTLAEIDLRMCAIFPGLMTPSPEWLAEILESYSEPFPGQILSWIMKPREAPEKRAADRAEILSILQKLGPQLGFTYADSPSPGWLLPGGGVAYRFHLTLTSMVGRIIITHQGREGKQIILLPGSRSNLLALKLQRDRRLAEAASGWCTIKFRHLRQVASREDLNSELWDRLMDGDPCQPEEPTQLSMFNSQMI